jgi:hypothetical protein
MKKLIENIGEGIDFFEGISDSIWGMVDTVHFPCNVGSVIFSAIANRLKTVRFAVSNGFLSDAYVLMRMIYEDIFTYTYLEVRMGDGRGDDGIRQWIRGKKKLHSLNAKQLFSFLTSNNGEIKRCFDLLDVSGKYVAIKSYCNDYVHNNRLSNLILNTDSVPDGNAHYERLSEYLEALKCLLFSVICILKPHYASSSDYMDHAELGLSPPDGCQYWVAPFMQEEFDKLYRSNRKLAEVIVGSSYMEFKVPADDETTEPLHAPDRQ